MHRFRSKSPLRLSRCSISSFNTENCVTQSQDFSNSPKFAQALRSSDKVLQESNHDLNKPEKTFFTTKGNELEGSFRDSVLHTSFLQSDTNSRQTVFGNKENYIKYQKKGIKRKPDESKESFISTQTAPMVN